MAGIKISISVKKVSDFEQRSEIIRKLADFFYKRVRFYTPVKTGKLKRGWRVTRNGNRIKLSNKVSYASYLDSGETKSKDPTKGFMYERSLKDAIKYIEHRYGIDLKKVVDIERLDL